MSRSYIRRLANTAPMSSSLTGSTYLPSCSSPKLELQVQTVMPFLIVQYFSSLETGGIRTWGTESPDPSCFVVYAQSHPLLQVDYILG